MAKDPAFLFYHHDFIVGTALMSLKEVGMYITIMCHLADKGELSEEEIKIILRGEEMTTKLKSKLSQNKSGNYFQKRLRLEVIKRKEYAKSRRMNRLGKTKGNNICKSYVPHMVNENENINEIKKEKIHTNNNNKKFMPPSLEEVGSYCLERKNTIDPEAFIAFYESVGWKIGNKPMKSWKAAIVTWEKRGQKAFQPAGSLPQKEFIDFRGIQKDAEKALGRMATDQMVKEFMRGIPEKAWWIVDKFIKNRYPGGDHGQFGRIEAQLIRERQTV